MGEVFYWRVNEKQPQKIDALTGVEIESFMIRDNEIYALTERTEGQLCGLDSICNKLKDGSVQETKENKIDDALKLIGKLKSVSCGKDYGVALSAKGTLYSWGANRDGQLGLGHHDDVDMPCKVVGSLRTKDVKKISCGSQHTMILTSDGDVYSFGKGDRGQHGHGERRPQLVPRLLGIFLRKGSVESISCGENFTVCSTTLGNVWSWGENQSGQLGIGHFKTALRPQLVKAYDDQQRSVHFTSVDAGWGHVGALAKSGDVYTWGLNIFGQLGLGDLLVRASPTRVPSFGRECVQVRAFCCGANYSVAISQEGELFAWGKFGAATHRNEDDSTRSEVEMTKIDHSKLRMQRAPIFGATYRRVAKKLLVEARARDTEDSAQKRSTPARIESLRSIKVSSVVCGRGAMAIHAMPYLERLSTSCGPLCGGTSITLHGSAFWNSDSVRVRFQFKRYDGSDAIFVPGYFDATKGVVTCTSPHVPSNVIAATTTKNSSDGIINDETLKDALPRGCLQAHVDVIFSDGSRTAQALKYVYYPQVKIDDVHPRYASSRGGTQLTIHGEGFVDFGCAVARFGYGDDVVYAPAKFVSGARHDEASDDAPSSKSSSGDGDNDDRSDASGRFVCTIPSLPVDTFPAHTFVSIAINGSDFPRENMSNESKDATEDDNDGELDMYLGEEITLFSDVIQRCVPSSVHLRGDSTTLQLKGTGFPQLTDFESDVRVKIECSDREWNVKGFIESATKISCAMPKLRIVDILPSSSKGETPSSGSVVARVSLSLVGSNYCDPIPIYLYAGRLESLSPPCGPISGGSRLKIYSAGAWFFPSKDISVRFKAKGNVQTVKGTYDSESDALFCEVPPLRKSGDQNSVQVEVAMNGSTFTSGRKGRPLIFSYYDPPMLEAIEFDTGESRPSTIRDALGCDVTLSASNLVDTGIVRVRFRRTCENGDESECIIDADAVDEESGTIRTRFPNSLLSSSTTASKSSRDEEDDDLVDRDDDASEHVAEEEPPCDVSISIALNGVDFSSSDEPLLISFIN